MRKFDLIGQTLIITAGLAAGIATLVNQENGVFLLVIQFGLGVWQMISSGISILIVGPMFRKKLFHFVTALVYLGTLMFLESMDKTFAIWYLIIPAWSLGIYYYVLTYRLVFNTGRGRGNFLPNLSF